MMDSLRKRFELMATRERWLMLITIVVVALLGTDLAVTDGLRQQAKRMDVELNNEKVRVAELRADLMIREAELARDPNDALREKKAKMQERLDARRQQTAETVDSQLIEPEQANAVIDYLLNRTPGLTLSKMTKLAPQRISRASDTNSPDAIEVSFHQHSVTLELRGSYDHVHNMVQQLSRRFPTLSFQAFEMEAEEYPSNRVTLNLAILTHSEDLWNE